MAITTFLDPTKLPARTQDQKTFDLFMADLMRKLPVWGAEINETLRALSAFAAGGAYAFPYVFDSATTDSDPGVGFLRLGAVAQNAATVLRIDTQIVGGADISAVFADLQSITSSTKGSIRLINSSDPSKWMILDVTSVAGTAGYRNLAVRVRATSTGATNPFANGTPLIVHIDRNGDSGTVPGATDLIARMNIESSVAVASLATVFDTAHDWYLIDIPHIQFGGRAVFEFCGEDGNPINTSSYLTNIPNSSATTSLGTYMTLSTGTIADPVKIAGLLQVRGVNTEVAKTVIWDGSFWRASTGMTGIANRCSLETGQAVRGFRIRAENNAQISSGLIRVYGVRKV